jgi:hypothetical protein
MSFEVTIVPDALVSEGDQLKKENRCKSTVCRGSVARNCVVERSRFEAQELFFFYRPTSSKFRVMTSTHSKVPEKRTS